MTAQEEAKIIEQVKQGDHNQFRLLVDQYKQLVFSAIYRLVSDASDAEDLAQESFIRAFNKLDQYNGEAKFSTWLYRIAINQALSFRRKKNFSTALDEDKTVLPSPHNSDHIVLKKEQRVYVQKAMDLLQEDDALVLSLFYLNELSLKEITAIIEVPENTLKVRLHRARKRLAEALKNILQTECKTILS